MTPNCDAIGCTRKSVHAVFKIEILKFRGIAVRVKIRLCPDHFNEAMEHQAKQQTALNELTAMYPKFKNSEELPVVRGESIDS